MTSAALELQDTLYNSSNPTRRWLHTARRTWVTDALRRLGRVQNAMDVGSGSGVYLPVLAEISTQVTALDIEDSSLARARELAAGHPNIAVKAGNIAELQWPAGSFDLILCSEVVEHIADSAPAIRAIARLLRVGGHLVLTTPHRGSILETVGRVALHPRMLRITGLVYKEPVVNPGHINLLTRGELTKQLRSAGLTVLERHSLGLYLPGIAEFGGRLGLHVEQRLEPVLRRSGLEWLLWTQCCICRRG